VGGAESSESSDDYELGTFDGTTHTALAQSL
jgi:hypothetical protein